MQAEGGQLDQLDGGQLDGGQVGQLVQAGSGREARDKRLPPVNYELSMGAPQISLKILKYINTIQKKSDFSHFSAHLSVCLSVCISVCLCDDYRMMIIII